MEHGFLFVSQQIFINPLKIRNNNIFEHINADSLPFTPDKCSSCKQIETACSCVLQSLFITQSGNQQRMYTYKHICMHVIWQYDSKCVFPISFDKPYPNQCEKLNTHTHDVFSFNGTWQKLMTSIPSQQAPLYTCYFSRKYIDDLRATFLVSFFNLYFSFARAASKWKFSQYFEHL